MLVEIIMVVNVWYPFEEDVLNVQKLLNYNILFTLHKVRKIRWSNDSSNDCIPNHIGFNDLVPLNQFHIGNSQV